MSTLLICHGTLVSDLHTWRADILIEDDRIRDIAPAIPLTSADRVLDAEGMFILPGGIDVHTHLDMPFGGTISSDDFETGTRAAAFGGTTTIVDFAIQARGTKMRDALDTWWKKAEGKACIDYGLHMIVTDLADAGLEDMDDMVREGVASFKLFMAYPSVLMVDDATIFRALANSEERRAHLHARGKRRRHRCHRAACPCRRENCADLSRPDPSHARRSRSGTSRHRAG